MKGTLRKFAPVGILLFTLLTFNCLGQGTAFTYQGRLNDGGNPASGSFDLQFTLWDAVTNGNQMATTLTNAATRAGDGLFVVTLDFGGIFNGPACWLDVAVRTNGGGAFTELYPRQSLTPVPYAIFAGTTSNLSGTLPATQLSGTLAAAQLPVYVATNGASGVNLTGTFSGNGGSLTNYLAANLVNDITIISLVDNITAPSPATNFAFYPIDLTSSNFLTQGGRLAGPGYGSGGTYYAEALIETGAGGFPNDMNPNTMTETFSFEGNQFIAEISGYNNGYSIMVNGVDNFVTNITAEDYNNHYITVTFATSAKRTVQLNNCYPFQGVYVPVTNGWWSGPLTTTSLPKPRMVVLGDSFTEQGYAPAAQCEGPISQLQLLLPNLDIWGFGEGGTGFLNNNPGNGKTNLQARVNDVIRAKADYIVIWAGINDCGYVTNTALRNSFYQAVTNTLIPLQLGLPNARIAVVGPQFPRTAFPIGDVTVFNCALVLSNACNDTGVPYINPVAEPWITGNVLIPNSGNAVIYTSPTDTTHPTVPAGSRFLASKMVQALSQFWSLSAPVANPGGPLVLPANGSPAPVPGLGMLWNSNNALYWVTPAHTNYVTGP